MKSHYDYIINPNRPFETPITLEAAIAAEYEHYKRRAGLPAFIEGWNEAMAGLPESNPYLDRTNSQRILTKHARRHHGYNRAMNVLYLIYSLSGENKTYWQWREAEGKFLRSIKQHILDAMKAGAKLVVRYYLVGSVNDGYANPSGFTLENNDKVLILNNPVVYPPFAEDPIAATCELAQQIIKCDEVQQGYSYRGDYDRSWKEIFEHVNTPQPRWVREQWGFDDDGNLINPDSDCPHNNIVGISEDGLSMCLSCGRTWDEAVR